MNNKLVVIQTKSGQHVIASQPDLTLVASIPDNPENILKAHRIVQCYNLFIGVKDPVKYFQSIAPKQNPITPEPPPKILPYNGLNVGDQIIVQTSKFNWGPTEVIELIPNTNIVKVKSIDKQKIVEIPAIMCKHTPQNKI
jgi:hypothetical protein